MNNEKFILELFKRIKDLETRIRILEEKSDGREVMQKLTDNGSIKKITRNAAIHLVIKKLKKNNRQFDEIYKGNRSVEGDIILVRKSNIDNKILRARFFHSKSHKSDYLFGWHTVSKLDTKNENYDLYIFTVAFNAKIYGFLILSFELQKILENKSLNKNNIYNFNFSVIGSDKIVENRDGEVDVSDFYERWELPLDKIDLI